jgi:DNA-binding XRE family transcriptional regulator
MISFERVVRMATFQERFNSLFEESGKSQEEFGKTFGASKFQVFNWRSGRGEPDSETMKLIALNHNVTTDWLHGLTDLRKPYVLKPGSPEYQKAMDKINKEEWHKFEGSGISISAKDKDKYTEEEVNEIVKEVLEKIKERKED